jgi:hypothetical protein
MRDPFEVLGLGPTASVDDAEHAYHHQLLRCHPDLHAAEGPEAVRRAEAQTLALNEAIDRIRRGYRPAPGSSRSTSQPDRPGRSAPSGGFGGSATRPHAGTAHRPRPPGPSGASGGAAGFGPNWWTGYDGPPTGDAWPGSARRQSRRVHRAVTCPFCDEEVTSLDAFDAHLARRHPHVARVHPGGPRRRRADFRARGWWPLPLWAVALINLALLLGAIVVVRALGGLDAVLIALPGHYTPEPCHAGSTALYGSAGCSPNWWIKEFLLFGLVPTVFVWMYRQTTRR